jgi:hypothetical protein
MFYRKKKKLFLCLFCQSIDFLIFLKARVQKKKMSFSGHFQTRSFFLLNRSFFVPLYLKIALKSHFPPIKPLKNGIFSLVLSKKLTTENITWDVTKKKIAIHPFFLQTRPFFIQNRSFFVSKYLKIASKPHFPRIKPLKIGIWPPPGKTEAQLTTCCFRELRSVAEGLPSLNGALVTAKTIKRRACGHGFVTKKAVSYEKWAFWR